MIEGAARPAVAILMQCELLGDAMTHVPAYRALRCALPGHRIVGIYRTTSVWDEVLATGREAFLDEVRVRQPIGDGIGALRKVLREVENVELVLDFRSNGRTIASWFVARSMGLRYVANVAGYMLRNRIALRPALRPLSNAARYHRAVELALGRSLPFDGRVAVRSDMRALAARALPGEGPFLCFAPGPEGHAKFWTREGWIGLARHVAAQGVTPVFLLGPAEIAERDWVEAEIPEAVVIDGRLPEQKQDLPWLFLAVAERALATVAYEGGIGHLVATLQRPVLTIGGPTNLERWRPVTPLHWTAWSRETGSKVAADVTLATAVARTEEMLRFATDRRSAEAGGE